MRRRNPYLLLTAVLHEKGPLTDAQLAWWMRVAFKVPPGTTRKRRWQMTQNGLVKFAGKVMRTGEGRIQEYWELTPEAAKAYRDTYCSRPRREGLGARDEGRGIRN
jgi:hypothetical protein